MPASAIENCIFLRVDQKIEIGWYGLRTISGNWIWHAKNLLECFELHPKPFNWNSHDSWAMNNVTEKKVQSIMMLDCREPDYHSSNWPLSNAIHQIHFNFKLKIGDRNECMLCRIETGQHLFHNTYQLNSMNRSKYVESSRFLRVTKANCLLEIRNKNAIIQQLDWLTV